MWHCFILKRKGRDEWFECPECASVARRFIVNAEFALGRVKGRLTSDNTGEVLRSYPDAIKFLSRITASWLEGEKKGGKPFKKSDWIPAEAKLQLFENIAVRWLRNPEAENKKG